MSNAANISADLPARFSDSRTEARAVRHGLACVPRLPLQLVRATGGDALDFVHRMVCADIKGAPAGRAILAALLTPKARIISTLTVIVEPDGACLCLLPRESAQEAMAHLERHIIVDDVELHADGRAVLGLCGPSLEQVDALHELAALGPTETAKGRPWDMPCLAVGDDHLGAPGLMLIGEDERDGAGLADRAREAGACFVGADAYETCRIEAGTPRMGAELSDEVLILEAGQLAAVSFDKGCYPGQEPVCRIHSRGQVNRMLVGLRGQGDRLPAAGEALAHPRKDDAGWVTSATRSAEANAVVALGYVHRSVAAENARLQLAGGGEVTLVSLPHVQAARRPLLCPRHETPRQEVTT